MNTNQSAQCAVLCYLLEGGAFRTQPGGTGAGYPEPPVRLRSSRYLRQAGKGAYPCNPQTRSGSR